MTYINGISSIGSGGDSDKNKSAEEMLLKHLMEQEAKEKAEEKKKAYEKKMKEERRADRDNFIEMNSTDERFPGALPTGASSFIVPEPLPLPKLPPPEDDIFGGSMAF